MGEDVGETGGKGAEDAREGGPVARDAPPGVRPNELTIPLLPCVSAEETLDFFQSLGFEVTYRQHRPYLYLAFQWSGVHLHYGRAPKGLDPAREESGGCLVLVDDVAAYHAALVASVRAAKGRVPTRGLPRITRYRAGASRFTVMDPSGNSIMVIQRDEPEDLDYGGSPDLEGLARVLDGARIIRDFKLDDHMAWRFLRSGLRRHDDEASAVERAMALAMLVELSVAIGETERSAEWIERLRGIELTEQERARVEAELRNADELQRWLSG
ncbi:MULTISPECIES: glyoxalase [unclassified Nocardiopsis]|uniref:glyoxalase n=1 Tax=Nocardiopsis TaxID=2013 RepID=UPI00387B2186